jgi:hypothetical protein
MSPTLDHLINIPNNHNLVSSSRQYAHPYSGFHLTTVNGPSNSGFMTPFPTPASLHPFPYLNKEHSNILDFNECIRRFVTSLVFVRHLLDSRPTSVALSGAFWIQGQPVLPGISGNGKLDGTRQEIEIGIAFLQHDLILGKISTA